ncbi:MAG: 2,3-bisphosphoglycerate-independent phosphoglycerate mutase [Nitrospirota bacterium]
MTPAIRPATLIIIDGWGVEDDPSFSAKARADTPFYDSMLERFPHAVLRASGEAVGLPDGQMGNSEVGHLNIGAGRIVYQDYTRINLAIKNGEFEENKALRDAMEKAKGAGRALHLLGLLSDGGVHSDQAHLYALLKMARTHGLDKVFVHAFMDGRDTPPSSGLDYMKKLITFIAKENLAGMARVATVSGRYYAMDRDNRWERIKKAYYATVLGEGVKAISGEEAVEKAYLRGETDEFIMPTVITDGKSPVGRISDGDSVIFFNFRTDRTRELTRAIALDDFKGFERPVRPKLASFVCMTEYDKTFGLPVAFPPQTLSNILGEVISRLGLRQLRIAETEKYAHVTFFFNGGNEVPFPGEDRCLIPSPRDVPTYDKKPQMSAFEVTDEVLKRISSGVYDVIIMNFANPDMVGHTGIMEAAIKACEAVDACLARIVPGVESAGGVSFVMSDHGNVEKMFDISSGEPYTAHTSGPVPFIITREGMKLRGEGILADVAPTILDVMGIAKPPEMTGESLIIK